MRGVGRLSLKTGAWIAASSAVAALTGLLVGLILRPANGRLILSGERPGPYLGASDSFGGGFWVACVIVALAFGVYRNQIDEPRARLPMRLALVIDDTITLLLEWAAAIIPLAVFCLATTTSATSGPALRSGLLLLPGLLGALAVGWGIYSLLLLPLILLVFARLNPWRYALAVGPVVLSALAGGSPAEVFPLTLTRVRVQAGVSNRVAGVALSGCTALLRDGHALGWALACAWMIPTAISVTQCWQIFLAAWLLGCAAAAISGPAAAMLMLSLAAGPAEPLGALAVTLGALIGLGGSAVNIFSQSCAAAVIAHSEGETNLLPPRPPPNPAFADLLLESNSP
jgi:proton glutamate symport protein